MPWDRSAPTNPKYRSKEHRAERARLARQMEREGYLICAQPECVMPSRLIRQGDEWHVGHDDSGTQFIGPVQAKCNIRNAAVRANRRSRGLDKPRAWTI